MKFFSKKNGTPGKKRRIKIGIRPQLIILVCFASLFSLLILATVIGVYVSNIVSGLRADRLSVIADLKRTQILQLLQFIYYQVAWLSQKDTLTTPLLNYRAGNYSNLVFLLAQVSLDQFLATSDTFALAKLYTLDLAVVAESTNSEVAISDPVEDTLYILLNTTVVPTAVTATNNSNAVPTGHVSGPLANTFTRADDTNATFFIGITMPIYANSSIIVQELLVAGYLTVVASAKLVSAALDALSYEEDYLCVTIEPIYASESSAADLGELIGFQALFGDVSLNIYYNTFVDILRSEAASEALTRGDGTATNEQLLKGYNVAIGFSRIYIDSATTWSVIVEQSQSRFELPVKELTKIMIGVVIGIGVFVCLITFPIAVWFVIPITKLKNAIESITRSKKEKDAFVAGPGARSISPAGLGDHEDDADSNIDEKNTGTARNRASKRNSINTASSGSSTVYLSGIHLPERIPQLKKLFKDEITELSEAFNIMTEELEKQYSHLEDRVRMRTKEIEASKIEAEAANEAKTVFIANISHELRTPLNGILGMTSIAMDETDHLQIQDSLKLIHRSGELLLHILTELLTYSKNTLNRSKLEKSNFQILEVVYQVKSIFSKLALDQRVNFKILLKPRILRNLILLGDSNRIIQVLMNLVSNSLKFTPVDGSVDVTIKLLGEYDQEASQKLDFAKVLVKKPHVGLDEEDEEASPIVDGETCTHNSTRLQTHSNDLRRDSVASKLKAQDFDEIPDNSSITTFSTTEYDDIMFRSQFNYLKPLPSTPPGYNKSPQTSQNKGSDFALGFNEKRGNSGTSCQSEIFNVVSENSNLTDISTNELVKDNKVYKMRKLYVPTSWVIQVEVRDTGPGIEPALQEKVFEPFIQGDQTLSRSYGGTGLGLSICRQLAKMMQGTLTLKSDIGKGSTFTFTVPLPQSGEIIVPAEKMKEFSEDEFNANSRMNRKVLFNIDEPSSNSDRQLAITRHSPVESEKEAKQHRCSRNNYPQRIELPLPQLSVGTADQTPTGETCLDDISHLKILVAEDNLVNQEVIKRMLKLEGFTNITMAVNGAEAVDLVKKSYDTMSLYDMIFMDVQMPKMDGLTATKIIRNNLKFTKPIVALTAFADESNVRECLNCGMSGFLSKPIKRTNLRKIVAEISPELLSDIVTPPSTYLEEEKRHEYFPVEGISSPTGRRKNGAGEEK
uniref:histidine kinase n=1 Tax=Metschnikowia australis TaxID=27321 RepID=A0A4Y5R7S3_9ASCO|nr:two-component system protein [Metschnikowia australis]